MSDTDTAQQGATGDQGADSGSSAPEQQLTTQAIEEIVARALNGDGDRLNRVVSDHVRRMEGRLTKLLKPTPQDATDGDAAATANPPKPGSKEEVEALKRTVETLQRDAESARESAQQETRMARLRSELAGANVPSVDDAETFFLGLAAQGKMKVGDDKHYYGVGENGEFVPLKDFVAAVVSGNAGLQPVNTKGGSGGTGNAASNQAQGASGDQKSFTAAQFKELCDAESDPGKRANLMRDAAQGRIMIVPDE